MASIRRTEYLDGGEVTSYCKRDRSLVEPYLRLAHGYREIRKDDGHCIIGAPVDYDVCMPIRLLALLIGDMYPATCGFSRRRDINLANPVSAGVRRSVIRRNIVDANEVCQVRGYAAAIHESRAKCHVGCFALEEVGWIWLDSSVKLTFTDFFAVPVGRMSHAGATLLTKPSSGSARLSRRPQNS